MMQNKFNQDENSNKNYDDKYDNLDDELDEFSANAENRDDDTIIKKLSNTTKIFFVQAFIFILIIAGAVFIKFYSSNLFFNIKENISSLMGESVVIENIFKQLDIFKEKAPDLTENVIDPIHGKAKDVINQLEDNISAQAEERKPVIPGEISSSGEPSADELSSALASGGRGTTIVKKDGIIYPEKSVSLASYTLVKNGTAPVKGNITSNFGYRINPVSKSEEFHPAVDIAAAQGTYISSFLDGEIVEASSNEIFGNFIKIKHGENLYTFYAHCDCVLVENGYRIRKGETIGTVGKTGWATGPHLHFEIIINDKFVDPEIALKNAN